MPVPPGQQRVEVTTETVCLEHVGRNRTPDGLVLGKPPLTRLACATQVQCLEVQLRKAFKARHRPIGGRARLLRRHGPCERCRG